MAIASRFRALLSMLWAVRQAIGQDLGAGFCDTGKCINCFSCNGECNLCDCNTLSNSCCCDSPRGSFSTGYTNYPCPGGTFQHAVGQSSCRSCNSSSPDTLYNLTFTGASNRLECREALCENFCGRLDDACRAQNCVTGPQVQSYMKALKRNTTFCDRLNISVHSCSWIDWSGAFRGSLRWSFSLVSVVLSMLFA
jgi:hypothetical protein